MSFNIPLSRSLQCLLTETTVCRYIWCSTPRHFPDSEPTRLLLLLLNGFMLLEKQRIPILLSVLPELCQNPQVTILESSIANNYTTKAVNRSLVDNITTLSKKSFEVDMYLVKYVRKSNENSDYQQSFICCTHVRVKEGSFVMRSQKKMCIYGHPTNPNFCQRPYQFLHRIRIIIFVV